MATEHQRAGAHRGGIRLPLLVLGAALGLTALLTHYAARSTRTEAQRSFEAAADEVHGKIAARLEAYVAMLTGGAALFAAYEQVGPAVFKAYVERLRLTVSYPGIQGIGYSQRVRLEERAALAAQTGLPDYRIWPEFPRPEYHAIVYLEPLDRRNRAAIGYDMYSDPVRREAMARARDTAAPAASGAVTLVQEIDHEKQRGFLIYVPVYRGGVVPGAVAARRSALLGFVYAPFRAHDLFASIHVDAREAVSVEVFDREEKAERLLYASRARSGPPPEAHPELRTTRRLERLGRSWKLAISSRPSFESTSENPLPLMVSLGGSALGLLLYYLTRRESGARAAAERVSADLRASQAALSESEARKGAIIESAIDCIITADHEGKIREFNPAAERAFGYARGEVLGRSLAETIVPPALRDAHVRGMERYLAGGQARVLGKRVELSAMRKDGGEFPVELGITAISFRERPLFTAHIRDITEPKRAEQALRESEQRFRQMADTAPVMIWLSGPDQRCTFFNRSWLTFRGRPLAEELAEGRAAGVHPDERPQFQESWAQAFAARRELALEYRLRRQDGEYRWVVDHGVPRFTADGAFLGYIGSCVDITNRKLLEEELERRVAQRTEELRAANQELEAFSYSVSHDLRAPLRGINGFANILLEDHGHEFSPEARALFARIGDNARHMGQLVDDLLAFARLGRQALAKRVVDPRVLVEQALRELGDDCRTRRVELTIGALPPCLADPVLLKQVFVNLLSNALKFTRVRERPQIEVGALAGEPPSYFVRDNGVGFDARYADKLFAVFQRLHSPAEFEGTGVGLALVQRIVQRHGGRVWAESVLNEGATFYFELERSALPAPFPTAEAS